MLLKMLKRLQPLPCEVSPKARQFSPQDVVPLDVTVRPAFLILVLAAGTWASPEGTPKDVKAYVPWGYALKLGQRPCERRTREPPTSQRGDATQKAMRHPRIWVRYLECRVL